MSSNVILTAGLLLLVTSKCLLLCNRYSPMHSEEFCQALYNLIDMKVIDYRDEYQMLLEYFTTTEELNAYLETREDVYQSLGVS